MSEHGRQYSGLEADWRRVGEYMMRAIVEVASEHGDEDFVRSVTEAAQFESKDEQATPILPNPDALHMLKQVYAQAPEEIMTRMVKIQESAHKQELADLEKEAMISRTRTYLGSGGFRFRHRTRK